MNARTVLSSVIRVAWLSAFGLIQLFLVMFGCVYMSEQLGLGRWLAAAAPFVAFFSLLYPVFVSQTFRTARAEPA